MIVSEKILPIRFYDNIFDQTRFNKHSNDSCQFELIYPSNQLPHFQFKRNAIFAAPSDFILKNVCSDSEYRPCYTCIPEGADGLCDTPTVTELYGGSFPRLEVESYDIETGQPIFGDRNIIELDCCKLKSISLPESGGIDDIDITMCSNDAVERRLKIVVDRFVSTAGFEIHIMAGSVVVGVITEAGTHIFDYYDTDDVGIITLSFPNFTTGDYFEISYLQEWVMFFNVVSGDDVQLDPADLQVTNLRNGTDIVSFCASVNEIVPNGSYYFVVKSGDDYYYSEVFKVVSLKEISNYYRLKWYSDCDMFNSVLYSTVDCTFINYLYLDAGLIKPEYNTTEDTEENGAGDLNARFKKWQKNLTFEVAKSPEFLTDALSAVFLHDNVSVLRPLNKCQDTQSVEEFVIQVTSDVSDVLDNFYQLVNLKLLLEDKVIDTACCNTAEVFDCTPCDYEAAVEGECGEGDTYYMDIEDGNLNWWSVGCTDVPRYSYTLRRCDTGDAINVEEGEVICYNGQYLQLKYYQGLNCAGSATVQFYYAYIISPQITSSSYVFGGVAVEGNALANTWVKLYHRIDAGAWVLIETASVDSNGEFYIIVPISTYSGTETTIEYKVQNLVPDCDYGESEVNCLIGCL